MKDHVEASQRDGDGRKPGGNEYPADGNPDGDRGQTYGAKHRQDPNREGIVPAFIGHHCGVLHLGEPPTDSRRARVNSLLFRCSHSCTGLLPR